MITYGYIKPTLSDDAPWVTMSFGINKYVNGKKSGRAIIRVKCTHNQFSVDCAIALADKLVALLNDGRRYTGPAKLFSSCLSTINVESFFD